VGEIITILFGAITALSSAVVYLYFEQRSRFKDVDAKLTECEKDRNSLWEKLFAVSRGEKIEFSKDRTATTEGR